HRLQSKQLPDPAETRPEGHPRHHRRHRKDVEDRLPRASLFLYLPRPRLRLPICGRSETRKDIHHFFHPDHHHHLPRAAGPDRLYDPATPKRDQHPEDHGRRRRPDRPPPHPELRVTCWCLVPLRLPDRMVVHAAMVAALYRQYRRPADDLRVLGADCACDRHDDGDFPQRESRGGEPLEEPAHRVSANRRRPAPPWSSPSPATDGACTRPHLRPRTRQHHWLRPCPPGPIACINWVDFDSIKKNTAPPPRCYPGAIYRPSRRHPLDTCSAPPCCETTSPQAITPSDFASPPLLPRLSPPYRNGRASTPSRVIFTGMIFPSLSNTILSMQTTRWFASVSPNGLR